MKPRRPGLGMRVTAGGAVLLAALVAAWFMTGRGTPPQGSALKAGAEEQTRRPSPRTSRPAHIAAPRRHPHPPARARGARRKRTAQTAASPRPLPSRRPPQSPPPQIKLLGTVVLKTGSTALVEQTSSGRRLLYREGQVVDGWRVDRILQDRIVLVRGPQREVIRLASARPPAQQPGSSEAPAAGSAQEVVTEISLSRDALNEIIHKDMSELITDFVVLPEYSDEGLNGFRVERIPTLPEGLGPNIGIAPGDVIREINGEPLTDPAPAFALYQGLVDGSLEEATLTVERGNRQFVLQYRFR